MQRQHNRHHARLKRHRRLRNRLAGTPTRPRLNVFRSSAHISAQLIDDQAGRTLVAASSNERELREQMAGEQPTAAARKVGEVLAERAVAAGYTAAVFDRGGYRFHGRVKALADGSRSGGLDF